LSDLIQIVSRLEQSGGTLALDGNRIKYAIPKGSREAQELLAELRKHRDGVTELLRQRASEPSERSASSMRSSASASLTPDSSPISDARLEHPEATARCFKCSRNGQLCC
jgi:ElaB/YqjD/DUF883 family membrane-anchored ribosome-binding protein